MLRVVIIGGTLFIGACYFVSRYARERLEKKENPLDGFAS